MKSQCTCASIPWAGPCICRLPRDPTGQALPGWHSVGWLLATDRAQTSGLRPKPAPHSPHGRLLTLGSSSHACTLTHPHTAHCPLPKGRAGPPAQHQLPLVRAWPTEHSEQRYLGVTLRGRRLGQVLRTSPKIRPGTELGSIPGTTPPCGPLRGTQADSKGPLLVLLTHPALWRGLSALNKPHEPSKLVPPVHSPLQNSSGCPPRVTQP